MKRNRNGSKRRRQSIQPYTYDQARRVLPYLRSIVGSVREHHLEMQGHQRAARRLAERPGRPDRTTLLAQAEETHAAQAAEERLHAALEELHPLDIYCLDPVRGEALVPFAHDEQLAWFIFDHFDSESFRFWRYQSDPLDTRRPLAAIREDLRGTKAKS